MWKLPQPRKSIKVAFGNISLDDFHCCLENPAGFSTVTHKPGGYPSTNGDSNCRRRIKVIDAEQAEQFSRMQGLFRNEMDPKATGQSC